MRYKTHRVVDDKHEIITGTKVTAGSIDDCDVLEEMIELHQKNTQGHIDTVVADSKYGTMDNFFHCHDLGIKAHIPSIEETNRGTGRRKGIFAKEAFSYNPDTDTFTCPGGQTLIKRKYKKNRKHYEYRASSKVCAKCQIRDKCTRSKSGRTLKRHVRQDEMDIMLKEAKSRSAKKDIKRRQDLSERSFAWSKRYGYKRARWRRLWRMEIQDFLIAAIQNITVLISQPKNRMSKSNVQECRKGIYVRLKWRYSSIRKLCRWIFFRSDFSLELG